MRNRGSLKSGSSDKQIAGGAGAGDEYVGLAGERKPLLVTIGESHREHKTTDNTTDNSSSNGSALDDQTDKGSALETTRSDVTSSASLESKPYTRQQWTLLAILGVITLASSFSVCLFPPFFPRIAEEKGASATVYGIIIGTNCLVCFLVTPIIGKHLQTIGVKFAFVTGSIVSGVCCTLSGFLEFFEPGVSFAVISIMIRAVHAVGNAGVICATFTYSALEFPGSVAKIFSFTRTMMNVGQLAGPVVGGAMYELGGFYMPFVVMGVLQTVVSFISLYFLPSYEEDVTAVRSSEQKKKLTIMGMLSIPTIWFAFMTFIVSTLTNGFLSINLEPKVFRKFDLSPIYIGLLFGLKDGTNSIATPIWGCLSDRSRSVKPFIVFCALLASLSLVLLEPLPIFTIEQSLATVIASLSINGVAVGGQQVAGVVDALREAVYAGYPDDATTHGLVAGLWSSLSGAGRFISRAGSGVLVDNLGFANSLMVVLFMQLAIAGGVSLYLFCKCCANVDHVNECGDKAMDDGDDRSPLLFAAPTSTTTGNDNDAANNLRSRNARTKSYSALQSVVIPPSGSQSSNGITQAMAVGSTSTKGTAPATTNGSLTPSKGSRRNRDGEQHMGQNRNRRSDSQTVQYVDNANTDDGVRRISVTQTCSPSESAACKSVSLPVHQYIRKTDRSSGIANLFKSTEN